MSVLLIYGDAGRSGCRPLPTIRECLWLPSPFGHVALTLMEAFFRRLGTRKIDIGASYVIMMVSQFVTFDVLLQELLPLRKKLWLCL